MKTILRSLPLLIGAVCLTIASLALGDARTAAYHDADSTGIHVAVFDRNNINIVDGDVIITASDGSEARVTPDGDLSIRGKHVSVSSDQRKLLRHYAGGIRDIQERGIEIGEHAVSMVGSMLGTLVSGMFDEDRGDLDQEMRAKAEPLKEEGRALCKDVKTEKKLQDQIVATLPAFQPYAVIDPHPEHDCHVDDNDIEV